MTTQTALELEFADGIYLFNLKLPQMQELEKTRGRGIFAIYADTLQGRYLYGDETIGATNEAIASIADIGEVVRLGLIGGGQAYVNGVEVPVTPIMARRLVDQYVYDAPLRDGWALAAAILAARIEGYDAPKKAEPASEPATPESPPIGAE